MTEEVKVKNKMLLLVNDAVIQGQNMFFWFQAAEDLCVSENFCHAQFSSVTAWGLGTLQFSRAVLRGKWKILLTGKQDPEQLFEISIKEK